MSLNQREPEAGPKDVFAKKSRWHLYLIPGLHQLRHKNLGEGLIFLVATFIPLPFAWWISPFFLIPTAIAYIGNFQEVRFGLPPDPPEWA